MSKHQTPQSTATIPDRDKRRMMVSANRGAARHRVRYIETSGPKTECTVCEISRS
ncbi:hypothetical protein [Gynuella sunshinyii]|uniref:Uncharacterized protein n=1 Tax=Gynuella sunshinyii YC6258 TaxID=1445510 RepID=A0A0C5VG63_9GAMM|nr:hypothetical protein [Gynuella sunshinyii]AJQ92403.1 hypothetical Protein YC6258_00353 [Gynuella sunshinyii YC6258]